MPVDSVLLEALLLPIPGDSPSGKELRYDPRYEQVKEARREDPDLPRGPQEGPRKLADYPAVVKLVRELLEKESKDLQLAAWLSEALLKRDGIGGLATGVRVLHGIVDRFWLVGPQHLTRLEPIDDVRASAAYRMDASLTLLRRTLAGLTHAGLTHAGLTHAGLTQ